MPTLVGTINLRGLVAKTLDATVHPSTRLNASWPSGCPAIFSGDLSAGVTCFKSPFSASEEAREEAVLPPLDDVQQRSGLMGVRNGAVRVQGRKGFCLSEQLPLAKMKKVKGRRSKWFLGTLYNSRLLTRRAVRQAQSVGGRQ
jgi:hypothetical protein